MSCLSKSSDCVNARPRFLSLSHMLSHSLQSAHGREQWVNDFAECSDLVRVPHTICNREVMQKSVKRQFGNNARQRQRVKCFLSPSLSCLPACSSLPHAPARIITGTWQRCTILGLVCATFELTLRSLIKNWSQNAQQNCTKHRSGLRNKEVKAGSDCWFITENNSKTIYYLKPSFTIKWTIAGFTKLFIICAVAQLYRLCCNCRPTVGSWANIIFIRKLPQLETLPSYWWRFLCSRLQLTNRRI